MIPHKSRKYRAILDLSFRLKLNDGTYLASVNEGTTLEAPAGAIDQMGHALSRIIHAFAEAEEDAKIFMAKYDIKDGFWRLDCAEGEEWNFAYVLPQHDGEPTRLVVPTSLQMGWVESPAFFCAASETGRDVAQQYAETEVGSLPRHKFLDHSMASTDVELLPAKEPGPLKYLVDVYVDDYINIAIPTSREQLEHVANAVLHGIHDVFPANSNDELDPISLKKLLKKEGTWALMKDILGFEFDGSPGAKTIQLEEPKRLMLLQCLQQWIRASRDPTAGIPFQEFRSIIAKVRHAFVSIPSGKGLLSPCNNILAKEPPVVFLHRNKKLLQAIKDCRTLIREATKDPTSCKELVMGAPEFVGVKDASVHGVGGIIIGQTKDCVPTVFRMEWPTDIKEEVRKTNAGLGGKLTNSDLELAGLLLLFLVMEEVCSFDLGTHIALFSDNSPTVSWVRRMAAKGSLVADQLLRALALRMKLKKVSPLTTLHIAGKKNAMTDIPSRSFGSEPKWFCKNNSDLLTLFNKSFPLPNQNSWSVFQPSNAISMRVISALRMTLTGMEEWRRLPSAGRHTGKIGRAMSDLFEWTLSYRESPTPHESDASPALQQGSDGADSTEVEKSKLKQYRLQSRPLAKRFPWPAMKTPQNEKAPTNSSHDLPKL